MLTCRLESPSRYWDEIKASLNKTIAEGLKDVARLAASDAANSTFPRGITGKTRDTLQKAIYKDISRAYSPMGTDTDNGDYLLKHRNAKGRVSQNTKRKSISRSSYESIKQNMMNRAGMAKSGWLSAAQDLKSTVRIPVWLRKTNKLGYARVRPDRVEVVNTVRYADRLLPVEQKRRVIAYAYANYHRSAQRKRV